MMKLLLPDIGLYAPQSGSTCITVQKAGHTGSMASAALMTTLDLPWAGAFGW